MTGPGADRSAEASGPRAAAPSPPRRARLSAGTLLAVFCVALAVRAAVGVAANGRGEMEGLAFRYEEAAFALAAGYGLVRPAETATREVDLVAIADSLAAHGRRLTAQNAPRITPARWRPSSFHPPGYPLLLLAIYRTLGPPVTVWARVLQALADAAACVLIALVGQRLAGAGAGRFAGFGAAVFLPLAYLVTSRVADGWTPALFALVFWLYLRSLDTRDLRLWAAAGLAAGALCLLRPDFAIAPPFFAGAAFVLLPRRGAVLGGAAVMLAVMALVLTPWALRNQRVLGQLSPGTTAAGMTLLQSVGQFANPYGLGAQDEWYQHEAQRLGFDGVDDAGADRSFRRRYLEILKSNPTLVGSDMARRLMLGLVPPYHWGYVNRFYEGHSFYEYLDREHLGPAAALRRHPLDVLRAYWDRFLFVPVSLLLLAGCAGLLLMSGRDRRAALFVLLPWAYVVLAHLPFFFTTRMVVPGVFAQLIALGWCVERWRGRAAPLEAPGAASA